MATPELSADPAAATPLGTIIHRKAQVGRAEHQARAMSLAKALRLTVAKVADTMFDMSMSVIGVRREVRNRDSLTKALEMDGLRMLFDGPDRSRAAIILDAELVTSLIQQQTMCKVLPDTGNEPRLLTATDAAICAPFFEALLQKAALMPEELKDRQVIEGYRFGVWSEDARILGMALDAQDYDVIYLDFDIAGGVRQGHAMFCMPQTEPEHVFVEPTDRDDEVLHNPAQPPKGFSETVNNLQAEVRISLTQIKISLSSLGQLAAGSVLELGKAPFDRVGIQTIAGQTIARGVLGQLDGQRAVCLQAPQPTEQGTFDSGGRADQEPMLGLPSAEMPEMGDLGSKEDATPPDMPDLPDMSDLPDLPDMSDLPDLPDIGASDGTPDLPDLPDLPELD